MGIGDYIRARRLELGLSQEALANKLNLAQAYISRVESGSLNFPVRNAGAMAAALGVRTEDVVMACLGSRRSDPSAVEEAFREVDERQRRTRTLRRKGPKVEPSEFIEIPVYFDISVDGTDIRDKPTQPIAALRIKNPGEGKGPIVAYRLDSSFGTASGAIVTAAAIQGGVIDKGDVLIIETLDRRAYYGEVERVSGGNVELKKFDETTKTVSVPRGKIWAWYQKI